MSYIWSKRETLTKLPRRQKQALVVAIDILLVAGSLVSALWLRLGDFESLSQTQSLWVLGGPFLAIPIFARFGLYRAVFRYISIHMGWAIVKAVSLYTVVLGTFIFLQGSAGVPRSVILINMLVLFVAISGSRVLARWWFTSNGKLSLKPGGQARRILIYGAGSAGVQLASALMHSDEMVVVGFVDDQPELHKKVVRGLTVHAPEKLEGLTRTLDVHEVLLAIPSAPRARRREIVTTLDALHIEVRTLPGLAELASGRVRVSDLRRVEVTDILGRDPVQPNASLLSKNITGKVVMVTGAGGSIGSELCRQIVRLAPAKLILFERSEIALYEIDRELRNLRVDVPVVPVLGTVLNKNLAA